MLPGMIAFFAAVQDLDVFEVLQDANLVPSAGLMMNARYQSTLPVVGVSSAHVTRTCRGSGELPVLTVGNAWGVTETADEAGLLPAEFTARSLIE